MSTIRKSGFFWVNPFYSKRKISLRVRNFETGSTTTPEVKNEMGKVIQKKTRSSGRPSKVNDRGMVKLALDRLRENGIVELDDERQAAMVSNLLVVLCGDRHAQPVVNAGTLHN